MPPSNRPAQSPCWDPPPGPAGAREALHGADRLEWQHAWVACQGTQAAAGTRRRQRRRWGGVSVGSSRDVDHTSHSLENTLMPPRAHEEAPARRSQFYLRPPPPAALPMMPIRAAAPTRRRRAASRGRRSRRAGRAAAAGAGRPRPPACRATPFSGAGAKRISGFYAGCKRHTRTTD